MSITFVKTSDTVVKVHDNVIGASVGYIVVDKKHETFTLYTALHDKMRVYRTCY